MMEKFEILTNKELSRLNGGAALGLIGALVGFKFLPQPRGSKINMVIL